MVFEVNYGQMNMYLTKDAHSTIITHEEAEAVRNIMEYRSRTLNMGGGEGARADTFSQVGLSVGIVEATSAGSKYT